MLSSQIRGVWGECLRERDQAVQIIAASCGRADQSCAGFSALFACDRSCHAPFSRVLQGTADVCLHSTFDAISGRVRYGFPSDASTACQLLHYTRRAEQSRLARNDGVFCRERCFDPCDGGCVAAFFLLGRMFTRGRSNASG